MTRHQLLRSMPAAELAWWIALEQIDGPMGPWAEDLRAARVCMNVARGPLAAGTPIQLDDFMPHWDGEVTQAPLQSEADMKCSAEAFFHSSQK
jgi:hypothetical protein